MHAHKILPVPVWVIGLALILAADWAQPLPAGAGDSPQLIIVLRPVSAGADQSLVAARLQEQFARQGLDDLEPLATEGPFPGTAVYLCKMMPGADASRLMVDLQGAPEVLRVEPNVPRHFLAVDPITGPLDEWFVNQSYYFDIGVVAMWAKGLTGISATNPITVAVIDTGVDLDHPDIDGNLVPGADLFAGGQPDDTSLDSHGSMVAGIISAEINNDVSGGQARGVAGIGGGDALSGTQGLRIMPVRISDGTTVPDCAQSAQAIDYARIHGARVINMSYGGPDACQIELEAVQRAYNAGLVLVAGAGNDNSSAPFYPAAYGAGTNDLLVIAVAGVYTTGVKANESNYGTWVDMSAPFDMIGSINRYGGYRWDSGTSFSTPLVSGLIGVLMSNYGWTSDQAAALVLASATKIDAVNPSYQGMLGSGLVNADRASAMVRVYLPVMLRNLSP